MGDIHAWIGIYLENVEGFELNVPAAVPEQVHHQLEILSIADVSCHDAKIGSVQQDLAEQLKYGERRTINRREREKEKERGKRKRCI